MLRRYRKFAIGVTALCALANATSAWAAGSDRSAAPAMRLAGAAAAPAGFLDFCDRQPSDCIEGDQSAEASDQARRDAGRRYWATLFGTTPQAPAALGRSRRETALVTLARPRLVLLPAQPLLHLGGTVDETVLAPSVDMAATQVLDETAEIGAGIGAMAAGDMVAAVTPALPTTTLASTPAAFDLDRSGWALVNRVNRAVNRDIGRVSDARQYGRDDYWATPTGTQQRGDCEDYVLAKRHALIEAGVPAAALSIAIVQTPWRESHAVLLLASDRGEFVLDSLSPWVTRWDRVDYVWQARQAPGRVFDWARVAS